MLHNEIVLQPTHSHKSLNSLRRMLLFRLDKQTYALPIDAISKIVPMAQLVQTPASAQLLAGMLNLGGQALPVLKLARLFGLTEQAIQLYTPLIVLRHESCPVALLVDAVIGMQKFNSNELVPLQAGYCLHDCASGLFAHAGEHVVLLDEHRLLSEQESRRLAELTAIEQLRWFEMGATAP